MKRPAEARDAREVAKKLLKSGAISAIPKPRNETETAGFKRSRGLERKLSSSDRAPSGFQPFSASQGSMVPMNNDELVQEARAKPKVCCLIIQYYFSEFLMDFFFQVPNLYENFVSSRDSDSEPTGASSKEVSSSPSTASPSKPERPKVGHTCYVFGYR